MIAAARTPVASRAKTRRRGVADRRKCAVSLALAAVLAGPLHAQPAPQAEHATPFAIRWGKWGAAALAVGFTALGVHQHNDGDAAYRELIARCQIIPCPIASNGRYADAAAEAIYQRVVRDDRSARAWLVGGELAAVGGAVLFILELSTNREPPNIPYSGLVLESDTRGTRVGWRIVLK
jgi:hypothetical protein